MPLDLARLTIARWSDPDPAHVPLLRQAGIEAVLLAQPHEAFARACAAAGIAVAPISEAANVVANGLWPGIRSAPNVRGNADDVASASREPWVDANGYLYVYERTVRPNRPPVLGYLPDDKAGLAKDRMVAFTTLELALVEARVHGGNYLLAVEDRYRAALLANDPKALDAWKRLGATAAWLRDNAALFGLPTLPTLTMLVEEGGPTEELANLGFRRNACPALAPATNPPRPAPERLLCLSAASIKPPAAAIRARIMAHAEAGATVVVDGPAEKAWWQDSRLKRVKDEGDRDVFTLGRGRVIGYRERIVDPSEFALDLIDFIGHRQRAARLWNAPTVILTATAGLKPGQALLHLVNYGSPIDRQVQVRIQGHFTSASLHRPDGTTVKLQTARRGTTTEVQVDEIGCAGTIVFG